MLDSRSVELSERVALLAAVADPIRLSVITKLAVEGCRCVCDLQADPPIPANQLSYHLKVLRDSGLVTTTRRGRWIDYHLAPDALDRLHRAVPREDARAKGSCCAARAVG